MDNRIDMIVEANYTYDYGRIILTLRRDKNSRMMEYYDHLSSYWIKRLTAQKAEVETRETSYYEIKDIQTGKIFIGEMFNQPTELLKYEEKKDKE